MATTRVTPIQFLRSLVFRKRPDPAKLLPGQPAVNTDAAEPGLFFADDTGVKLFKVGPCAVGTTAPNSGATGSPGQLGNTLGELWLDTSTSTLDRPTPLLKVWNGTQWINAMPYTYASTIVSDVEPNVALHPQGTLWWDSGTGLMYVLYTGLWVQVSSAPVS